MSEFTADQLQMALAACTANLQIMGETFLQQVEAAPGLELSGPIPFSAESVPAEFDGPGIVIILLAGAQSLLALVPEALPLPAWYRDPSAFENNRLQTLAFELSRQMLPDDLPVEKYKTIAVENLKTAAINASPAENAAMLVVSSEAGAPGKLLIVVPVNQAPINAAGSESRIADTPAGDFEAEPVAAEQNSSVPVEWDRSAQAAAAEREAAIRALRIMRVPVTVSVRLAERKMPLGQVAAFGPGALISFNKSCEDLLELYVNNRHFGRGEAVKIGENFGLKLSRIDRPA